MSSKETKNQSTAWKKKVNLALSVVVLILLVLVPPLLCGLFYLSQVPDITWGNDQGLTFTRIWLYRDRGAKGIGYQNQHIIKEYSDTAVCAETRLRFFLWAESSKAEPATTSRELIVFNNRWQPSGELCS